MPGLEITRIEHILCIGAHSDDIEIGAGGTLLKLLSEQANVHVTWVVASGDETRQSEARRSAEIFLEKSSGFDLQFWGFRDGFLPYQPVEVKEKFFSLQDLPRPDLVLTHRLEDRHQDHRFLADLTWNTFRNHLIWEYEIPKVEGDLGSPNLFVPVSKQLAQQKASALLQCYGSQRNKQWFDEATFFGLMRIRGLECCSESGFAEAFTSRKTIIA